MLNLLIAYGAGIAFALGVFSGAILCRISSNEGRKEFIEENKKETAEIKERLGLQVEHLAAIARAADALYKSKQ